jgi:negative regulator of replication initiation
MNVKKMVQYTLAQSPEVVLTVPGKDSAKAREKAIAQIVELMDAGKLAAELADGFSPDQLIEIKETNSSSTSEDEDAVTQAVQILNNLATLKIKVQEIRAEALKVRERVNILFTDETLGEEEMNALKEGFKVLKNYAQLNLRYLEVRSQAEAARAILDRALQNFDAGAKPAIAVVPVPEKVATEKVAEVEVEKIEEIEVKVEKPEKKVGK